MTFGAFLLPLIYLGEGPCWGLICISFKTDFLCNEYFIFTNELIDRVSKDTGYSSARVRGNIKSLLDELGYERGKTRPSYNGKRSYVYFSKDKKTEALGHYNDSKVKRMSLP